MRGRVIRTWIAAVLLFMSSAAPAAAQSPGYATELTSYVRVNDRSIDLFVRVPLSAMEPALFPAMNARIDLSAAQPGIARALGMLERAMTLTEDGIALRSTMQKGRLTLPSDREFDTVAAAAAHVTQSPPADTEIYTGQGFLDAYFQYPITSDTAAFTLQTDFGTERINLARVSVRYLPLNTPAQLFVIDGAAGGVALNPTWLHVARDFLVRGAGAALGSPVQLLLLLALVLPVQRLGEALVAGGTLLAGQSVVLLGASGTLPSSGPWFDSLPQVLTAAALFVLAVHNGISPSAGDRPLTAGASGLAGGLLLSSLLLPQMQFAGEHSAIAPLAFHAGIVLAEAAAISVSLAVLALPLRLIGRIGVIVMSAVIGHAAWHWFDDGLSALWDAPRPAIDGRALLLLVRWLALLLIGIGLIKVLAHRLGRGWRHDEEQGLVP